MFLEIELIRAARVSLNFELSVGVAFLGLELNRFFGLVFKAA